MIKHCLWFFHSWGKWSKIEEKTFDSYTSHQYVVIRERTCNNCGKIQTKKTEHYTEKII